MSSARIRLAAARLAAVGALALCACDELGVLGALMPRDTCNGGPDRLVFVSEPRDTTVLAPLSPVYVDVVDADGCAVTGAQCNITLALGSNPSGAALLGTTTQGLGGTGGAAFSQLRVDRAADGYTLVASSLACARVASATSAPFNILPAAPSASASAGGRQRRVVLPRAASPRGSSGVSPRTRAAG
jgi:hypothetical protein